MRILFDISDPADVHFFKNAIKELIARGNSVLVTSRDKEVNEALLRHEGISYISRGEGSYTLLGKSMHLIRNDLFLLKHARNFQPDLLVGSHNPYVTHIGTLLRIPSLIFSDSEHAHLQNLLMYPFASQICVPDCYYDDIRWGKVYRYPGYHALAYLHPLYYSPDSSVLSEAGIRPDEPYVVVRFIAWTANHDHGQSGIPDKIQFIKELSQNVRVIISSEGDLPAELTPYHLPVPPWRLHDLLYYASLYIGEGATIASEAAVLGTHALYVSTMKVGYTIEQEERYHLVTNFLEKQSNFGGILQKALELLQDPDLGNLGKQKRHVLLTETIDVTTYILDTIYQVSHQHVDT